MIQDKIDKFLAQEQEDRSKRIRSGLWSPSSFGRCYRYQVWNRRNEPPTNPIDARTLRVFKAGKLFHDFVQQYFDKAQVEVKAAKEDIFGYADIVLEDSVVDIKSVHSRQFFHTGKKNYDIEKEKFSNILQLATYAWILGKPKCLLVFISKDDLCIDEYAFFTKKWVDKIEEELKILRIFWENKGLPPAIPRCYNGKECKYCSYEIKCKEIENGHK